MRRPNKVQSRLELNGLVRMCPDGAVSQPLRSEAIYKLGPENSGGAERPSTPASSDAAPGPALLRRLALASQTGLQPMPDKGKQLFI